MTEAGGTPASLAQADAGRRMRTRERTGHDFKLSLF